MGWWLAHTKCWRFELTEREATSKLPRPAKPYLDHRTRLSLSNSTERMSGLVIAVTFTFLHSLHLMWFSRRIFVYPKHCGEQCSPFNIFGKINRSFRRFQS